MKLSAKGFLKMFREFKNTETAIERCSKLIVLRKAVMQCSCSIHVVKLFDHF